MIRRAGTDDQDELIRAAVKYGADALVTGGFDLRHALGQGVFLLDLLGDGELSVEIHLHGSVPRFLVVFGCGRVVRRRRRMSRQGRGRGSNKKIRLSIRYTCATIADCPYCIPDRLFLGRYKSRAVHSKIVKEIKESVRSHDCLSFLMPGWGWGGIRAMNPHPTLQVMNRL